MDKKNFVFLLGLAVAAKSEPNRSGLLLQILFLRIAVQGNIHEQRIRRVKKVQDNPAP